MKDKVGILFYEVGNLKSIANALSILNIDFKLIENSREIKIRSREKSLGRS